jgi:flagellar basal-body rod protein FlgF
MVKGIYHSAAGMLARQRHLEIVANNLANANTAGFRQENICFRETLNSSLAPSNPVTGGEKFVDVESTGDRLGRQGTLSPTGNPLDVAIVGEGWFVVETANGPAYTRDGRFSLNAEGELVTLTGYRVQTVGGTLMLPDGQAHFTTDGSLVVKSPGESPEQVLDRLRVVYFEDPSALRHTSDGLYVSGHEPVELTEPRLQPGYMEESNVNVVAEMVKMIEINQYYDASARALQTQDATLGKAVNEVGKA